MIDCADSSKYVVNLKVDCATLSDNKSKEKHAEQIPCSKVAGKMSVEKGLSALKDNAEPGKESATEKCEAQMREDRAQRLEEMLIFLPCFALFRCLSFYVYLGFGCCVINDHA